jgi:hypothetical protein
VYIYKINSEKMLKDLYHFLSPKFQNLFLEYKTQFKPRYGYGNIPHKHLFEIINSNRDEYANFLSDVLLFEETFRSFKKHVDKTYSINPAFNNGYLPGLDVITLYTMLYKIKPERFIEIGSGYSTKVV